MVYSLLARSRQIILPANNIPDHLGAPCTQNLQMSTWRGTTPVQSTLLAAHTNSSKLQWVTAVQKEWIECGRRREEAKGLMKRRLQKAFCVWGKEGEGGFFQGIALISPEREEGREKSLYTSLANIVLDSSWSPSFPLRDPIPREGNPAQPWRAGWLPALFI